MLAKTQLNIFAKGIAMSTENKCPKQFKCIAFTVQSKDFTNSVNLVLVHHIIKNQK